MSTITPHEKPLRPTHNLRSALEILSKKYTLDIINELLTSQKRFTDIHNAILEMSTRTLTQRLEELERNSLIARHVFKEIPPRVEYSLNPNIRDDMRFLIADMRRLGEKLRSLATPEK